MTALTLLAAQLALGGWGLALAGRMIARSSAAGVAESARLAGAAGWIAAAVAFAAAVLGVAADGGGPVAALADALQRPAFAARAAAGALSAPGCFLLLSAGRAERFGRLVRSRRLARHGGLLLAAGGLGQALADAAALAASAGANPSWIAPASAAAAGAAGLLGGLSGKPRPSGALAAILLVAGALAATSAW